MRVFCLLVVGRDVRGVSGLLDSIISTSLAFVRVVMSSLLEFKLYMLPLPLLDELGRLVSD